MFDKKRSVAMLAIVGSVLLLHGCGGGTSAPSEPVSVLAVDKSSVELNNDYGQLVQLYKASAEKLRGLDPAVYVKDYQLLDEIAGKLVNLKLEALELEFSSNRLDTGEVPLPTIKPAYEELATPPVPDYQWLPVREIVEKEWSNTQNSISNLKEQVSSATLADSSRLSALDQLILLTGDNYWDGQKSAFIDGLIKQVRDAKSEGLLTGDYQDKIDLILNLGESDQSLRDELIAAAAEIFQKDYFNALAEGDADKAYGVLVTMSEAKDFAEIKGSLTDISQKMSDYFVALADSSVEDENNLAQSYRWYDQARNVSQILSIRFNKGDGYQALIEQLQGRFSQHTEDQNYTAALAYLHLLEAFEPRYRGLQQQLVEARNKVVLEAVKDLSVLSFDSGDGSSYGDIISSKITQYLFRHIPNDVRIIERQSFDVLARERAIESGGTSQQPLEALDLLVTGSIQEAKVDSAEQKGKKTIRVVVGKDTIPNQAYIKWLELPAKERQQISKPDETITIDKEENIPISETRHKKVGIFSASYRLVDAKNSRVLFPDSHTEKEQYTGTSQEGVELNNFKRDFVLADLPSDVQILDNLANKVADVVGARLVEQLKDQELKHLQQATAYKQDGDCARYTDSLAKALVVMDAKGMDSKQVYDDYNDGVLNCTLL